MSQKPPPGDGITENQPPNSHKHNHTYYYALIRGIDNATGTMRWSYNFDEPKNQVSFCTARRAVRANFGQYYYAMRMLYATYGQGSGQIRKQ